MGMLKRNLKEALNEPLKGTLNPKPLGADGLRAESLGIWGSNLPARPSTWSGHDADATLWGLN